MPRTQRNNSPIDSDVDLHDSRQRRETRRHRLRLTLVIALGGALGAVGRWLLSAHWPWQAGSFPVATFCINLVGCFLIGVLMVLIDRVLAGQALARPFLGVGVLGGFTTFSTYAVDANQLLSAHPALALLYFLGTPALALAAVIAGSSATMGLLLLKTRTDERGIAQ